MTARARFETALANGQLQTALALALNQTRQFAIATRVAGSEAVLQTQLDLASAQVETQLSADPPAALQQFHQACVRESATLLDGNLQSARALLQMLLALQQRDPAAFRTLLATWAAEQPQVPAQDTVTNLDEVPVEAEVAQETAGEPLELPGRNARAAGNDSQPPQEGATVVSPELEAIDWDEGEPEDDPLAWANASTSEGDGEDASDEDLFSGWPEERPKDA
ncbi:MAG: hypothetical protein BRC58_04025 [Cyanobacteria bacterium QS_8_64_29]|nr:MAG: hypothetical protein BRC58_04025 [Cyanobacteria bacterium QS_8_64_29]